MDTTMYKKHQEMEKTTQTKGIERNVVDKQQQQYHRLFKDIYEPNNVEIDAAAQSKSINQVQLVYDVVEPTGCDYG